MWRRSDLAFHRDAAHLYLPWIVAFMVFMAILAAFASLYLQDLSFRWKSLLGAQITIELPYDETVSEADTKTKIDTILQIVGSVPGIQGAQILTEEEMTNLLRPWLGQSLLPADLPLPVLIKLVRSPQANIDMEDLHRKLSDAVPEAALDNQASWLGGAVQFLDRLKWVSWFILILTACIVISSVAMICRTSLAIHHRTIEIVHLMGAQDSYLARQFQSHALKMGLQGGCIGFIFAAVTLGGLAYGLTWRNYSSWGDILRFVENWDPFSWGLLISIPFLSAILSMITARYAVLSRLKVML